MRLLAHFKQPPEYIHFCIAELKSLFALHNVPHWDIFELDSPEKVNLIKDKPYRLTKDLFPNFPFVFLKNHHNETMLKSIISRSILVKSFVRVYSQG